MLDNSSIVLLHDELRILKKIHRTGSAFVQTNMMYKLMDFHLIERQNKESKNICVLTDDGKRYLQYLKNNSRKFWIPVVISITALIGAYRQELVWLIQELMRLWK